MKNVSLNIMEELLIKRREPKNEEEIEYIDFICNRYNISDFRNPSKEDLKTFEDLILTKKRSLLVSGELKPSNKEEENWLKEYLEIKKEVDDEFEKEEKDWERHKNLALQETKVLLEKYGYLKKESYFTKVKRLSLLKKSEKWTIQKIELLEKEYNRSLDSTEKAMVRDSVLNYLGEKNNINLLGPNVSEEFKKEYNAIEEKYNLHNLELWTKFYQYN